MSVLERTTTRPPRAIAEDPRSVWTSKDEAMLAELNERKKRIMEERREPLALLAQTAPIATERSATGATELIDMVDWLIANAEALRDALAPFDGRTTS